MNKVGIKSQLASTWTLLYILSNVSIQVRAARLTRTYGLRLPYVGYGYRTVSPLAKSYTVRVLCAVSVDALR
jgi:hypothetical protein